MNGKELLKSKKKRSMISSKPSIWSLGIFGGVLIILGFPLLPWHSGALSSALQLWLQEPIISLLFALWYASLGVSLIKLSILSVKESGKPNVTLKVLYSLVAITSLISFLVHWELGREFWKIGHPHSPHPPPSVGHCLGISGSFIALAAPIILAFRSFISRFFSDGSA